MRLNFWKTAIGKGHYVGMGRNGTMLPEEPQPREVLLQRLDDTAQHCNDLMQELRQAKEAMAREQDARIRVHVMVRTILKLEDEEETARYRVAVAEPGLERKAFDLLTHVRERKTVVMARLRAECDVAPSFPTDGWAA